MSLHFYLRSVHKDANAHTISDSSSVHFIWRPCLSLSMIKTTLFYRKRLNKKRAHLIYLWLHSFELFKKQYSWKCLVEKFGRGLNWKMSGNFFTLPLILFGFFWNVNGGDKPSRGSFAPLVLVPGNSGSQIEVKINLSEPLPNAPSCPTQRDWFRAWMSVYEMLPGCQSS